MHHCPLREAETRLGADRFSRRSRCHPRIGIKRSSISDSSLRRTIHATSTSSPPPPDGTPAAEARRAKHCPTKRSGSTPLVRALALHGVSGDSGSHLGSTLKPGGAVLTLGVFRRSRSVACIRADASPSEVLASVIVPSNSTRVNLARAILVDDATGCRLVAAIRWIRILLRNMLWLLMNHKNLWGASRVPQRRGPAARHRGRPRRPRRHPCILSVLEMKIIVCLPTC
jgi:hypothetical protein